MWTIMNLLLLRLLQAAKVHAAAGPTNGTLDGIFAGLYITPTGSLSPAALMAAITEATYTGYARQPVVWYNPFIDLAGPYTLEGAGLHFSPTDAVTPNTITGVFLADAITAGNLLAAAAIGGIGIPLGGPTNALTVTPIFQLPVSSIYGSPRIVA